MGPLVTTEWLADELGKPDLIVFDATKYLPNEPKDGRIEFLSAHVPGARYFDIDEVADPDTDLPHMVPSQGRFARLAGALGVGEGSDVVVYDARAPFSAPRAWWLFRLFGHERVRVLDGGLPAWRASGHPLERGPVPHAAPRRFTPRLQTRLLAGLGDVERASADGSALLLDARAAALLVVLEHLRAHARIPVAREVPRHIARRGLWIVDLDAAEELADLVRHLDEQVDVHLSLMPDS